MTQAYVNISCKSIAGNVYMEYLLTYSDDKQDK